VAIERKRVYFLEGRGLGCNDLWAICVCCKQLEEEVKWYCNSGNLGFCSFVVLVLVCAFSIFVCILFFILKNHYVFTFHIRLHSIVHFLYALHFSITLFTFVFSILCYICIAFGYSYSYIHSSPQLLQPILVTSTPITTPPPTSPLLPSPKTINYPITTAIFYQLFTSHHNFLTSTFTSISAHYTHTT